jgi:hypothetical protein
MVQKHAAARVFIVELGFLKCFLRLSQKKDYIKIPKDPLRNSNIQITRRA